MLLKSKLKLLHGLMTDIVMLISEFLIISIVHL